MAAQKMNINAKATRPIPDEITLQTMARNGGSHLNKHQVRAVVERELQRFLELQKGAKGFHQQTSRAAAAAMQHVLDILDGNEVSLPVGQEQPDQQEKIA